MNILLWDTHRDMKINSHAPTGKQYKTDNENVLKISGKGGTAFPDKVTFEL